MLKLSTRGEYGVRAMLELGLNQGRSLTVQEISSRQGISAKYLEHLLSSLKKAGLVRSERGPRGGYRLSRQPAEIDMAEILVALEGQSAPVGCLREEALEKKLCFWQERCALQQIWMDVQSVIENKLKEITLEELCRRQKAFQDGGFLYQI